MLTAREREILELMAQGFENAQIGAHLGITRKTVEQHRYRMSLKARTYNGVQLLRKFYDFVPKQFSPVVRGAKRRHHSAQHARVENPRERCRLKTKGAGNRNAQSTGKGLHDLALPAPKIPGVRKNV